MSRIVLRDSEFGFTQASFQAWEKMRKRLSVIPHMSLGTVTTPGIIAATLPGPKSAIALSQDCWRFENREIGGNCFEHFRWQRRIVKAITKTRAFFSQLVVMISPKKADAVDINKTLGVPGT